MIYTVVINSIFSLGFIIALLYCIGDYQTALLSPTGFPIIEVLFEATKSTAATNVMMITVLVVVSISNFSIFAS
jgi:choline transport protein